MSPVNDRIQAVYDRIPKLECKRLCAESCGPILYTVAEGQAMMAAKGVLAKPTYKLECSMLSSGACTIYESRPLVCRLWGVVRSMRCPHGCVPERWLSEEEGRALMQEVSRIGGGENREVYRAVQQALKRAGVEI